MNRNVIEMEGATLGIGDSAYIDCPACGRQRKMGITKSFEGILYNCFSTHCGERGFVGATYVGTSGYSPVSPKNPRWVGVPKDLTPQDVRFFQAAFGIKVRDPSQVMWDIKVTPHDEYLFPIHNINGRRVGEVIRQPVWSNKDCHRVGRQWMPKAKTYLADGQVKLDYHGTKAPDTISEPLIIVEDQISAFKVRRATGFNTVALLGNSLSSEIAMTLVKLFPTTVFLWLDPDMRAHAYEQAARFGGIFRDFVVLESDEDPKDMTKDEIQEVVSE